MNKVIEAKLRGCEEWVTVDADYLSDIEIIMSGHGFKTRYIGKVKPILSVENPLTGNVECFYRSAEVA